MERKINDISTWSRREEKFHYRIFESSNKYLYYAIYARDLFFRSLFSLSITIKTKYIKFRAKFSHQAVIINGIHGFFIDISTRGEIEFRYVREI